MASTTQTGNPSQLDRYESFLQADPGNRHLLAQCIDLALDAGDTERASAHADAAMLRYPEDDFFAARRATVLLAQRRWPDAVAVLEKLYARHPDVALAFNLATAYSWLGKYDDAARVLAPFESNALANGDMAALLVRVRHHRGEVDAAMAFADAAMATCGGHPSFLAAASLAYFDGERLDDAVRCSDAALAGNRHPQEALVASGSLASGAGDASLATQRFERALEQNPEEGRAWAGMGVARLLAGDFKAAEQHLGRALERMPGHIGSWHALAWARLFAGDLDGAQAAFSNALDLDRNFADSHGGLAVVDAIRGRRNEAEAAIERALRLDRTSLAAVYARLIIDGETVDPKRFRQIALRLLAAHPALPGSSVADVARRIQGN